MTGSMGEGYRRRDNPRDAWLIPILLVGGVLVLAAVVELVTHKLDGADPAFFATTAQVAPVFGLAVFIEVAVVMAPVLKTAPSDLTKTTVQMLIRANAGLFLLSETSALFATGASRDSGFLVMCIVLPWLAQLLLVVDAAYYRVGLSVLKRRR
jgi:hypothetical protein